MKPSMTKATKTIRVVLVEDDEPARLGLRTQIEKDPQMTVAGEAATYRDAVRIAEKEQPDIILLDLNLGDKSGMGLLPELSKVAPESRVIIVTGSRDDLEVHQQAITHGAMGLVRQRELNDRVEVEIDDSRLIHVAGECRFDVSAEQVLQQRAAPIEIRPQAPRRRVILGEESHIGNGAGEDAAISALRRSARRVIDIAAPVGRWRRGPGAKNLLQRTGESGVVDGATNQCSIGGILEEADPSAHHRAWAANGAGEAGNLGSGSVAPRKSGARAEIEMVRRAIIALAENTL